MIELEVNGNVFSGWVSADVTASIKEAVRTFEFKTFDDLSESIDIGSNCKVLIDGQIIVNGYIDVVESGFDETSTYVIFSGRSKTSDILDCSSSNARPFKNKTIKEIASILCAEYDINVICDIPLSPITYTQQNQGDTIFSYLHRLCDAQGLIITTNAQSDLIIGRASNKKILGFIDVNNTYLFSGNAINNQTERFSEYVVKGQSDTKNTQSTYKDGGVTRYRKKVLGSRENSEDVELTAKNTAIRLAGQGLTANLVVGGFYSNQKELFTPNTQIHIKHEFLRLDQLMLIEGVRYSIDNDGFKTTLDFVDSRAYFGKKPNASKSGKKWKKHPEASDEKNAIPYRDNILKEALDKA
jgi:prophage tail gpP-like protein